MVNPFEQATSEYDDVRPSYPAQAIDALVGGGETGRGQVHDAADIGAGTGKMATQLAARGVRVAAVEPSSAMRAQLQVHVHDVNLRGQCRVFAGTAEDTGLLAEAFDLVVFAQSWHWVDPLAASVEAARILKPAGQLAAVFNQLDVRVPWVKRLTRIMRSGDVHRPDRPPAFDRNLFEVPELSTVQWTQHLKPEQVMELGRTRSSWLRQDQAGRDHMQNNLRWYLYEHLGFSADDIVELPYTTLVWTARRLSSE